MAHLTEQVKKDMEALTAQWAKENFLQADDLVVIGCSTSEIAGEHIGTAGSEEIAAILFDCLQELQRQTGIQLAYQCCEHLNRALVMDKATKQAGQLEEVSVIPAPSAGGSMASYAFKHMQQPVVVESVRSRAQAGIDIGGTMIGMHLKHVAVPVRFAQRFIGNAHINGARTRPKLIGGERARYQSTVMNQCYT